MKNKLYAKIILNNFLERFTFKKRGQLNTFWKKHEGYYLLFIFFYICCH